MRQLPSPEFRKVYPRLTEPVEVTALGRIIGTYVPVGSALPVNVRTNVTTTDLGLTQKERDAILRRINRKTGEAQ